MGNNKVIFNYIYRSCLYKLMNYYIMQLFDVYQFCTSTVAKHGK
jgi:hypothetical protein